MTQRLRPRREQLRRSICALTVPAALAALTFGGATAPANAQVVEVERSKGGGAAEKVKVGEQPSSLLLVNGSHGRTPNGEVFENSAALKFGNPTGAPIVSASKTYAVYWDPTDHYHGDWQGLVNGFFQRMNGSGGTENNVFTVDSQYTDKKNQHALYDTTFMGAYTDVERYPTSGDCTDPNPLPAPASPSETPDQLACVTDAQVREVLQAFINQHDLQTGMGTIFYVLTPPGVTVCLDEGGPKGHCSDFTTSAESAENSFCSYHSYIDPTSAPEGDAQTILYAVIPWTAGGFGDGHLSEERPGYFCQDGGYDPSSTPGAEQYEKKKQKTKKQEEEEAKEELTLEEEEAKLRQEILEGPHAEEPNQPAVAGPDGYPDSGLADLIINQVAVEQQNVITDPLLDAWQDPEGKEATDECRDYFAEAGPLNGSSAAIEQTIAGTLSNQVLAGTRYYLNDAFSLTGLKLPYPGAACVPGIALVPLFTAPNPVNSGEVVNFDGMESNVTLNSGTEYTATGEAKTTYATYKWNFGDGTPEVTGYAPGAPFGNLTLCEEPWQAPCAGSIFHAYQYGGTYQVTLTVTDTGGNTASITQPITVVGPPAPSSEETSSGGTSGGSATPPGSATPGVTSSAAPAPSPSPAVVGGSPKPGPKAEAAVTTSSLRQVAKRGLVVRYNVNEQVAGRFEVLLATSIAHSLGITGPPATGLPAGSASSIVIGHALLVTTKGGHSSMRIKFSKRIAKHLKRAHKVTLTLRLKVRDASKSPLFTTVISTVVLHH